MESKVSMDNHEYQADIEYITDGFRLAKREERNREVRELISNKKDEKSKKEEWEERSER